MTMTRELAEQAGMEFRSGVLIRSVRDGSAVAGAFTGIVDRKLIITGVGWTEVTNVKELTDALKDVDLTKGVRLSIAVYDGERYVNRYVVLKLDE